MNWIKEKIKKWWKWGIGLLIPVALAAPLFFGAIPQCTENFNANTSIGTPPDSTIYRVTWRESFLNRDHLNEVVAANPKSYPHCAILPEEIGFESPKVLILVWEEYISANTQEAISKINISDVDIATLEAKDLSDKWVKKYDRGKIPK